MVHVSGFGPITLRARRLEGLLDTLDRSKPLDSKETSRLRTALAEISPDDLAHVSQALLERLGIEGRFQPAIAYMILSRRFPELVPKSLGDNVATGLKGLVDHASKSAATGDQLDSFLDTFQGGDVKSALPSDLEVSSSKEKRPDFALPGDLPGRPGPTFAEKEVVLTSTRGLILISTDTREPWKWTDGARGGTLESLSIADLRALQAALERRDHKAVVPELLRVVQATIREKEHRLEAKLQFGVGRIADRDALERYSRLVPRRE